MTHFDNWWKHYPRKENKETARTAYGVQVKVLMIECPDDDTHEILLDGLKRWCSQPSIAELIEEWKKYRRRGDGKFLPLPSTWLRAHKWKDEMEPTATPETVKSRVSKMDDTTKTELARAALIRKMRCSTCGDHELTFIGKVTKTLQCCRRQCYQLANGIE